MNHNPFSRRNIFLLLAGSVLIIAGLACSGNASTPPPSASEPTQPAPAATSEPVVTEAPSEPEPTQPVSIPTIVDQPSEPAPTMAPTSLPAIPESRRLTLEFPPKIRVGEGDVIRLTLEVDSLGNITPTAMVGGNVVTGNVVQIPNLYETHNVTAEARLDLAGVDVKPSDVISEPLLPGQSVTFYWSIRPGEVGVYRGTVWLYLRFVDKVSGEESRKTVSAQRVEIDAVNLLGLPLGFVRWTGGIGSFVGGVIGFPFFGDIVKFLFRRRKRA